METPLGHIQVGCGQHRHLVYKEGEKGSWGIQSAEFLVGALQFGVIRASMLVLYMVEPCVVSPIVMVIE